MTTASSAPVLGAVKGLSIAPLTISIYCCSVISPASSIESSPFSGITRGPLTSGPFPGSLYLVYPKTLLPVRGSQGVIYASLYFTASFLISKSSPAALASSISFSVQNETLSYLFTPSGNVCSVSPSFTVGGIPTIFRSSVASLVYTGNLRTYMNI